VVQLVETLRYEPEGRVLFSHWSHTSCLPMVLGPTQLLTEMSTKDISCGVKAAGA